MTSKKNMVRWVLMYLILTIGMWMFLYSYSNSYNKMNDEKIPAAAVTVDQEGASVQLIGRSFRLETDMFSAESDLYFVAYMLMPAECRALCTAECAWEKKFGL